MYFKEDTTCKLHSCFDNIPRLIQEDYNTYTAKSVCIRETLNGNNVIRFSEIMNYANHNGLSLDEAIDDVLMTHPLVMKPVFTVNNITYLTNESYFDLVNESLGNYMLAMEQVDLSTDPFYQSLSEAVETDISNNKYYFTEEVINEFVNELMDQAKGYLDQGKQFVSDNFGKMKNAVMQSDTVKNITDKASELKDTAMGYVNKYGDQASEFISHGIKTVTGKDVSPDQVKNGVVKGVAGLGITALAAKGLTALRNMLNQTQNQAASASPDRQGVLSRIIEKIKAAIARITGGAPA